MILSVLYIRFTEPFPGWPQNKGRFVLFPCGTLCIFSMHYARGIIVYTCGDVSKH
jgi:hypothetical protein